MDIDIEDNGDGTFSIYYTVKDAGEYTLSIKFGGQPVPDGVYNFTVSQILAKIPIRPSSFIIRKEEKENCFPSLVPLLSFSLC